MKIAQDSQDREKGFGNFTAQQTMVLRNKHGQESRRQLRVKVLEVSEDGDKSLFVFDEPRDVKGTALLIHAHRESADDQWLYLPRLCASRHEGGFGEFHEERLHVIWVD
ncbi:MAG: outer membrane lipoprotein-sorting protein, partial [Gemmatimonadota bacterium]|nr:outer membrane lipoprotein-sorting protein [Gemmatimonadota bacterium]